MPQFEVGQQELVDVHHYTYLIDLCGMLSEGKAAAGSERALVERVNQLLAEHVYFSTQQRPNYEKMMSTKEFMSSRNKFYGFFLAGFMSVPFFTGFLGLGFAEINPKEKEINSLTQTVFYSGDRMRGQAFRMEHEFEKECINQMARSTQRKFLNRVDAGQDLSLIHI